MYAIYINHHVFVYSSLNRTLEHLQIAADFGREERLLSETDHMFLKSIWSLTDRDLPWRHTTKEGVKIKVVRNPILK